MSEPQDRPLQRTRLESADLRGAWERNAEAWLAWARTPGHDSYWQFHRDLFLELLPAPGRRTLDLGCGEGRLARDLKALGHDVVAVDSSELLVDAARGADPELEAHVADAAELPFADASFDLAVAFMSLQDMDNPRAAVRETARVLGPAGRFCLAVVHPFNSAGRFAGEEAESPFVIEGSYLEASCYQDDLARSGLAMQFVSAHRPLEAYAEALADAGFLIERLREPAVPEAAVRRPRARRWQRLPLFLHVRAVKPR
jgi:SAM-dependent methyltransferase